MTQFLKESDYRTDCHDLLSLISPLIKPLLYFGSAILLEDEKARSLSKIKIVG
jgi:hypothetical protein